MSCTYINGQRHYCDKHHVPGKVPEELTPKDHILAVNMCNMINRYDKEKYKKTTENKSNELDRLFAMLDR